MKLLRQRSRGFTSFAVLTAAATAFSCIGVGLISFTEDAASTIRGYANRLHGAYTVEPSGPYLGLHPGKDKGRAVWTQEQIGDACPFFRFRTAVAAKANASGAETEHKWRESEHFSSEF